PLSSGVATFTSAALPAGSHSLTGVYVGDDGFTGSTSPALTQAVNYPVPAVTGLAPASVPEGSAVFTLTITGTNFLNSSLVGWNGTPLTITSVSGTQIQATVPASLLLKAGTANVVVSNPVPGGGASLGQSFTVTDAPLTANPIQLSVTG